MVLQQQNRRKAIAYKDYVNATTKVKRWDRSKKEYSNIDYPTVIQEYNKSMGGVDLADMLISLYRTAFKTKRWYIKVIFHLVDIAKVNSWLVYRRHCDQLMIQKKSQLSLLQFTSAIADALTTVIFIQGIYIFIKIHKIYINKINCCYQCTTCVKQ